MKVSPRFRFYRTPLKLYEICRELGRNKNLIDCLIQVNNDYAPTCSKQLKLDNETVVEYGCNAGQMSLLYLENYNIKRLYSFEVELAGVQVCEMLREIEEIDNWEIQQKNLIEEVVPIMRDTTILQDPFTYDNYYNLTEDEYINACRFMVEQAMKYTTPGGRFIVQDHGEDIFDYKTMSKCELGKNTADVVIKN